MLTIANKGGYMVKKCQKPVYVICEGSLIICSASRPLDFKSVKENPESANAGQFRPQK